jgi:4'-phosphopantetheinyl transferase
VITLYYTSFESPLPAIEYNYLLSLLPLEVKNKALRFRQWKDTYACLFGKLLLQTGLEELGCKQNLHNLQYDLFGRPFFKSSVDFNISHSGSFVICAFSTKGRVGVDLEKIEPINIQDFKYQWNENEWEKIVRSSDKVSQFFSYWTMKEAVMKLDGRGLNIPLHHLAIQGDEISCEGVPYKVKEIPLHKSYSCHVASKGPIKIQKVKEVELSTYLPFLLKRNKS